MRKSTGGTSQETIQPISSLIIKSEKAQQKVMPGTWQHKMLKENLDALHIALALMRGPTNQAEAPSREDLQAALHAFAAMAKRSKKALAKFTPGTSQYSLQRNRLKAFRAARAAIKAQLK